MESFRGTLARGGKNTSFFQMQLRDEANPGLSRWGVSTSAEVDQGLCPLTLQAFEKA